MKTFLWVYAVVGTLYFLTYSMGNEIVARYAVGPLWLMMSVAPVILGVLIFLPLAQRLRLFDK
jgi:hypothetical protein